MRSRDTHDDFLRATMGCMDLVYNLARRLVIDGDDAQDLVQETYLAAYRAWVDDRRPDRVEPWLATICLNLGRSAFRRRSRRPQEVPLDGAVLVIPDGADPAGDAIASLDRDALHEAMRHLPDEQRTALTLVDLGGLSTAEAAHAMGTPRGTVLSRLHRGRRALALLLDETIPEREVT
jgi:RNA polymerase sigma-70 factor (ECF subfamily)